MARFAWSMIVMLGLSAGAALAQQPTEEEPPSLAAQSISLQKQLETGLQARLPGEFEYLRQVVLFVQQGKLSLSIVRSTFDYAREKRPYPIQYFRRALRIRARRVGQLAP